ncbi:hypothetical protein BK022_03650 [Methylorubrum extorquens]|uniref:Uncharacterized protein n=1 Tax=Methylorubrum extorquens TaxID=408 RepID=A0A1S1PAW7_METEX|nr:hypothetical protein BK022_03650 [Methylorubrum extorquens]
MPYLDQDGVATLTKQDEVAAIRIALANTLGEGVGDLDAIATAASAEMDRIATAAYDAELSQHAAERVSGGSQQCT